jgi:hypothetical protein
MRLVLYAALAESRVARKTQRSQPMRRVGVTHTASDERRARLGPVVWYFGECAADDAQRVGTQERWSDDATPV